MKKSLFLMICMSLALVACGDDDKPANDAANNAANNDVNNTPNNDVNNDASLATFHRDLRPLLEANCISCHSPGGAAPAGMSFDTPEKVKAFGPAIVAAVEAGTMPPWQANDGCNDYKDDMGLSADEIEIFRKWQADGMVEGNPADFSMPEARPSEMGVERLAGEPTLFASSDVAYEPPSDRGDDFRCFVVDPGFDTDRFMQGFEVVPDNFAVLHHMVVFAVPGNEETLNELAELEAEDAEPGFECFGGARTRVDTLAAVWAPGGGATPFPEGTGLRIKANARFVIQMHYNTSEGGRGLDKSGINFWFYPKDEEPEREGEMIFVGNMPFRIPGGVDGGSSQSCDSIYAVTDDLSRPPAEGVDEDTLTEEQLDEVGKSGCVRQDFFYTLSNALEVHAVFPHMHLAGTHIDIELLPVEVQDNVSSVKEDDGVCLLKTDRWDFNWQRFYWLDQPAVVPPRGTVRLTCRFDNRGSDDPVNLGDGSRDEMCLGLLYLTPTN